jgi:hypothetical protein
MSTSNELQEQVGKYATLAGADHGIQFYVKVVDAKVTYGRVRYEVIPASGYGHQWVAGSRLSNFRDEQGV